MKFIYNIVTNPKNTYLSNIYEYENFMESYFDNLTINHGVNLMGSCGYIGIEMLLLYYDTYLSDNIVPEQYDNVSNGICSNMICRRNSPGSLYDAPDGFNDAKYTNTSGEIDIRQKNIDYYNYVESHSNVYLHAKLLTLGKLLLLNNYNSTNQNPAAIGHSGVKLVIRKYMKDILDFDYGEQYWIDDIKMSLSNDSDDVREFIIQKLQSNTPVMISIKDEDGEGHWAIAYDYDANDDKIYCNFG